MNELPVAVKFCWFSKNNVREIFFERSGYEFDSSEPNQFHLIFPTVKIANNLWCPPFADGFKFRNNAFVLIKRKGLVDFLDFEKFAAAAKRLDVPLIIDNTLATPYLCRTIEHGANIVIHSATKYTDGHATSLGGIIIDGGNFNWDNGKFPGLVEPDSSYHGLKYMETFGAAAYIVKARVSLLRDFGCTVSPFNSFMFHLGLETLHLRMARHSENALMLAEFLESHPMVEWVKYPGLKSSRYNDLAKKYLPKGSSGILTFGIKGGAKAGKDLIKHLDMVALVVHLGDLRTSILHPASTTHRQLDESKQADAGIYPEMIRVSVGIEDIADIIKDFDKALKAV